MIKLTNPMNRDGILYEKGAILTLSLNDELELISNGLAEEYPSVKIDDNPNDEVNKEDGEADNFKEVKEVQTDKEDTTPKEIKKTSTRIGRTSKK